MARRAGCEFGGFVVELTGPAVLSRAEVETREVPGSAAGPERPLPGTLVREQR